MRRSLHGPRRSSAGAEPWRRPSRSPRGRRCLGAYRSSRASKSGHGNDCARSPAVRLYLRCSTGSEGSSTSARPATTNQGRVGEYGNERNDRGRGLSARARLHGRGADLRLSGLGVGAGLGVSRQALRLAARYPPVPLDPSRGGRSGDGERVREGHRQAPCRDAPHDGGGPARDHGHARGRARAGAHGRALPASPSPSARTATTSAINGCASCPTWAARRGSWKARPSGALASTHQ